MQRPSTKEKSYDTASVASTVSCSGASQWRAGNLRAYSRSTGVATSAGMEQGCTKTNQDASFIMERVQGGNDFLCAVIDGHGTHGHHVSEFIKQNFAQQFFQQRKSSAKGGTRVAITRGFVETNEKLRRARGIDSQESGAVVTMCMRRGEDLYVANAGDTRAVLVSESSSGSARAKALTRDHTPALASERQRILKCGGEIAPTHIPGLGYAGPPRVWTKQQQVGGLAVTRALGDTSLGRAGVTPQPEVLKYRVKPGDKNVILASDGCWDYVTNDRAAEIALRHSDPQSASEAIVREARHAWHQDAKHSGYIDDITCVVAKVQ